jgi:hypothetical protein
MFLPACLLVVTIAAPSVVGAQDATPSARAPLPPCTAEPRDVGAMVALWFDASGAPLATPFPAQPIIDVATLPEGERPDDATVAAITETTQNWFSCLGVSGQIARAANYMTDNFLVQFGPDLTKPEQDTAEEVRATLDAQLAATPVATPESGEMVSPMVGPRRPRLLSDGRVGAIWVLRGNRFFFIYKQVDGKWLIDDAINIIEPVGTPAATPAP